MTNNVNEKVSVSLKSVGVNKPRPFLKWAGGKRWELATLQKLRPKSFGNYHEPFLGGGAHFFNLQASGFTGTCYLSDLNGELTRTYSAIQMTPELVIEEIHRHIACHCKPYFYELRDSGIDGMTDAEVAARMIYLNQAVNNGLYRVNKHGRLNVAWGKRDQVRIDEGNLFNASFALQTAVITQGDFGNILNNAVAGDFALIDPPYPGGFVQYTAGGFGEDDHRKLHEVCVELDRSNISFIQTNRDCPFIRNLYLDFQIVPIETVWSLSSKAVGRKRVGEVLIMNY